MREKRPTVRDIAQDAGVSIATVSRFLNQDYSAMSDATKRRINEVVTERGYVNQKARAERTVAVVIPTLTDPFFAMTVETVSDDLTAAGFSVQLCLTHDSLEEEQRIIRSLLIPAVAGIVYMSTVTSKENCYEMLKAKGKPFVVLDSYLSEYNVPALAFSNGVYGMYNVTKSLLELGHRRIAYLSGLRYGMFENHRYQGYVNALLDAGIAVNPKLARFLGFSMADGISAFRDLRASGEAFTAVICESDQLAAGVYRVCAQEGVSIDSLTGHGGLFKTPVVGQSYMAAACNAPVTCMETAGEGGPYGMALLAAYLLRREEGERLEDFLSNRVFAGVSGSTAAPDGAEAAAFGEYIQRYKALLQVERAAAELL